MFGPITPSQYDICFSIFRFPVRVHWTFWLGTVLLGFGTLRNGPAYLLAWAAVVFVSILIHELGHAFASRQFGAESHITLYFMGGLAQSMSNSRETPGRRILISASGPMAGFAFFFLLKLVIEPLLDQRGLLSNRLVFSTMNQLLFINLMWGLINLIPVWPLDGGQILSGMCRWWNPRDGQHWAHQISVVFGIGAAVLFFQVESTYAAMLFGVLAMQNLQILQGRHY